VRRALGWHRFGRRWTRMAQRHHSSCVAPGLLDCRLCAMTRRKMRSTMLSTAPSRCMK
jgi:hypothetical protein